MRRLNVLVSAYCCEPGKGSEEGVGWNVARGMAERHEVWVITRANNRAVIEEELEKNPAPGLHPVYYDLPKWAMWWKQGGRGLELYYYLWQLGIYRVARRLQKEIAFDVAHHATVGRFWRPSFLAWLDIPFIWGPVGGGESAPRAFLSTYGARGAAWELVREAARWLGENDPFVKQTARRSCLALTPTPDTLKRLRALGADQARRFPNQTALSRRDMQALKAFDLPGEAPVRFLSIGRLIHWKGYHLSLRAFAQADIEDAEYWFVGDGRERKRLEALARDLRVQSRVKFLGRLPRADTLRKLEACHAFVHPSLHDFFPTVCLEAMAAGRPVLCLNVGGPAVQVAPNVGIKVEPQSPEQTVGGLARAMQQLARTPRSCAQMGERARERAQARFTREHQVEELSQLYAEVAAQ